MKISRLQIMRHLVQCAVLLLFLVVGLMGFFGNTVMGEGVFYGTLSSSTLAGLIVLTDPYAFLGTVVAAKAFPFALVGGALTVVVMYTIIRGRAFCGWVCPLGLFSELAGWIGQKTGIRKHADPDHQAPRYSKIVSAVLVLCASALVGLPLFELISPVTALPRLFVLGVGIGLWLFLAIILVELFFPGRLWCRHLCPVGGMYELLGPVGLVGIRMYEGCIHCDKCKEVCLADSRILDEVIAGTKTSVSAGDCMICGKCVDVCPVDTLGWRFGPVFMQPVREPRKKKSGGSDSHV